MASFSGNLLSPVQIGKLGHEIGEIRLRALGSIYSKYNLQLVDESNVENNKQLLDHLLNWLRSEELPHKEKALDIVLRVAGCDNFTEVVQDLNADKILQCIGDIENKTDSILLPKISKLKDFVLEAKRKRDHPVHTKLIFSDSNIPERTEVHLGFVEKTFPKGKTAEVEPLLYLPWQSLAKTDRQILVSTYEGLRYVDNTGSILQSCQFLKDVILQDFPAEIFLQRPLIVHTLLELLRCPNEAIRIPVLKVLTEISHQVAVRIKTLNDLCMRGTCWKYSLDRGDVRQSEIDVNETEALKKYQISIPEYCNTVLRRVLEMLADNTMLEEKNLLICLVVRLITIHSSTNEVSSRSVLKLFEDALLKCGQDPKSRISYFTLLTAVLDHLQDARDLTPVLLSELSKCIGDPSLLIYFPALHELFLSKLCEIQDQDLQILIKDYTEALQVCSSMDFAKDLNNPDFKANYFKKVLSALPSLEFHKNVALVRDFFKLCFLKAVEEDPSQTEILLKLLSHRDEAIQTAAYEELNAGVSKYAGAESAANCTGDRLAFLYHQEVWKEMLSFGANSSIAEVQRLCRNSLVLMLKSRPLTSEEVWSRLLSSLQPCLGLLVAYSGTSTTLGRCVLRLFEPYVAETLSLHRRQLLLGNIGLLFIKEISVNEEAFARLCWLLVKDDPDEKKLLKIGNIKGLHLSSVCVSVKPKPPCQAHPPFSSLRVLKETLAMLENKQTEANSRRSALGQLSVILEDPSLQLEFLNLDGLRMLLDLMESALTEDDLSNYPTSVVPVAAILKNLAVRHTTVRHTLSSQDSVIINILRSLLLFTADEAFRQDAAQLLFLLAFNDVILEISSDSTMACRISLPYVVSHNVHVPLTASVHGKYSLNALPSSRGPLMGNTNTNRLLRVYWTALWMGDMSAVLALTPQDLSKDIFSPGLPADMRPTSSDLENLQNTALRHVLLSQLQEGEQAAFHEREVESIQRLTCCLTWLEMYNTVSPCLEPPMALSEYLSDLDSLPWAATFGRFLLIAPSCMEDEALLSYLVSLLRHLLRAVDSPAVLAWVTELVTNPSGVFVGLLKSIGSTDYGIPGRNARYEIISLAQDTIMLTAPEANPVPWITLTKVILQYLNTDSADHLNCLMGLLADITGAWTWNYEPYRELYCELVTRVMEVIVSFKGLTDPMDSYMGSNIINNALIVLGQLLADGSAHLKGWEQMWYDALREAAGVDSLSEADYSWLLSLARYRDPLTRATALTLISGLFTSARAFQLLVDGLELGMGDVWGMALAIVLDAEECALVREKAAILLGRLTALGSKTDCSVFLDYIKNEDIYGRVGDIVSALDRRHSQKDSMMEPATTQGLAGALCSWMFQVLRLDPSVVSHQMAESTLIQSVLGVVAMEDHHDEDWLRMNTSVTKLVRACVRSSSKARDLVLVSPEHVQPFCGLLHPSLSDKNEVSPELGRLWQEVLYLLATLLETPAGSMVLKKALQSSDVGGFLQVIADALSSSSTSLRQTALLLVGNLATNDLSPCFSFQLPKGSFAEVVCEALLTLDLTLTADTLACVFGISAPAQKFALKRGYAEMALLVLRKMAAKLNVYTVDDLRKPTAKKKMEPVLDQMESVYQMLTNFCFRNSSVKFCLADSGLADAAHKLWPWYGVRSQLLHTVLKLLCTFSFHSERACQSLALTTSLPGPRKDTILHSVIHLVSTEMDLLSKTRDVNNLRLGLQLLSNSCDALECRVVLAKGAILAPLAKLLPSGTKKRGFADPVFAIWFHFLDVFTCFPEGQLTVPKDMAAMELIFLAASGSNPGLRERALTTLTHLALHPQNRCRLLSKPAPLLSLLMSVLRSDHEPDIRLAAAILWSLGANSQKSKLVLRSSGCEGALLHARRTCSGPDCQRVLDQAILTVSDK